MPKEFKFLKWSGKKAVAFLILTLALVTALIGSTLAYLIVFTDVLTNQFVAPELTVEITNDEIDNTGDVDVYVRAALVSHLVDGDGKLLSETPSISLIVNSGWVRGNDGFYYYTQALKPADDPITLINEVTSDVEVPDGYTLKVTVLSEAIQALPKEAVMESWTTVTAVAADGTLTVTPYVTP